MQHTAIFIVAHLITVIFYNKKCNAVGAIAKQLLPARRSQGQIRLDLNSCAQFACFHGQVE